MDQIRHTLDALEHSNLGVQTILLPSLNSVMGNILLDLKERAYVPYHPPADGNNEWTQVQRRNRGHGTRRGGASGGRDGNRGSRGRGEGSRDGDRGSQRQRHTKGNGDDERRDNPIEREEKRKAQPFINIICVWVKLNAYSTPEKGDERQQAVRKRSIGDTVVITDDFG